MVSRERDRTAKEGMTFDEEGRRVFKKIDGRWERDNSCYRPLAMGGTVEADFDRGDAFEFDALPEAT